MCKRSQILGLAGSHAQTNVLLSHVLGLVYQCVENGNGVKFKYKSNDSLQITYEKKLPITHLNKKKHG